MKKSILIPVILLAAVLLYLANAHSGDLPKLKPGFYLPPGKEKSVAENKSGREVLKHVRVAGIDYAIPVGYFRPPVELYIDQVAISLGVMKNDFSMLPENTETVFKKGFGNEWVPILTTTTIGPRTVNSFAEITMKRRGRNTVLREEYGLDLMYSPEGKSPDHGEMYIYKHGDEILTFIRCSKPQDANSVSVCTHHFDDNYIKYQLSYQKEYGLKEWRDLEQKTQALFKQFRQNAEELGLKDVAIDPSLVHPLVHE